MIEIHIRRANRDPRLYISDRGRYPSLGRNSLEDVETIRGRGRDHTRDLSVPVDFLDMLLPLVDE